MIWVLNLRQRGTKQMNDIERAIQSIEDMRNVGASRLKREADGPNDRKAIYIGYDDLSALNVALEALKEKLDREAEPQGWISVKDKLPPPFVDVVVRERLRQCEGIYYSVYHLDPDMFQHLWEDATHWMMLPEVPMESEDEADV